MRGPGVRHAELKEAQGVAVLLEVLRLRGVPIQHAGRRKLLYWARLLVSAFRPSLQ